MKESIFRKVTILQTTTFFRTLLSECFHFYLLFPLKAFKTILFKACLCYFLSNFYFFTKWQPFKNYEKCFLFHLKCTFHSWDIHIFVYLSFPFFLPAGHCFKGWSKINLKSWCHQLSENLITHFVWYLVKGKSYDVETLSIDRVSDKEHCYRKIMQKMSSKSSSQTSL